MHAYSTVGLTMVVYAADFTGFVQSLRFRRKNPSILFPLPTMLSICLSHDKSLLMVTHFYEMIRKSALYYINTLNWIFIVLVH